MFAGGDQRLLLALDQRAVEGLLLLGGGTQGVCIALCIGLQALADARDQRFGMRALAIAEGLQVLAQITHQRLLRLGLFTTWPSWLRWRPGWFKPSLRPASCCTACSTRACSASP